ncbi:unnamed protein product [Clavelina lepadiformis]|uniref:Uncharacterized protein n=1 Tax=Clavelina lepadiformis TaxID=159417 RepID=A0ABP0GYB8_CLALP
MCIGDKELGRQNFLLVDTIPTDVLPAGTHGLISKSGSEYLSREDLPNCLVECADQRRELAMKLSTPKPERLGVSLSAESEERSPFPSDIVVLWIDSLKRKVERVLM